MIALRPYQIDAIQQTRDRLASGRVAPLLVAPTGAGKTVIEAEIVRLHLSMDPGNKVLVVAHRKELIGQIARTLLKFGITDIGEILPGVTQRPRARVQVASTQTLRARSQFPDATLILFDEAHHYSSDDWHELTRGYPGVIRIGFTATPMRSDGRGMSPAFDSLVVVSTIKELTALGYLVPCRVIACNPLKRPKLSHSPLDAYRTHAIGKRTVVFADYVENAEKFAAEFRVGGVPAVVVHGAMTEADRNASLRAHAGGAVLVNCMVLTEGWDSPETSVCILARGCGNIGTYLQIAGRVLRPFPGKTEAILIDLTGRSYDMHGPPDSEQIYSLTGKGIRTSNEVFADTYCPVCGQPVEKPPNSWPCGVCGHKPEGQIEAPVYTGDPLTERYAAKRAEGDDKRIETLARLITECKARGNNRFAAHAVYRSVYSHAPPANILQAAEALSKTMACVACIACKKPTVRTYHGGKCGKCAFPKTSKKT